MNKTGPEEPKEIRIQYAYVSADVYFFYPVDLVKQWRYGDQSTRGPNYHLLNFHTYKPPPLHRLSLPVNHFQCSHRAESRNESKRIHRRLKLVIFWHLD